MWALWTQICFLLACLTEKFVSHKKVIFFSKKKKKKKISFYGEIWYQRHDSVTHFSSKNNVYFNICNRKSLKVTEAKKKKKNHNFWVDTPLKTWVSPGVSSRQGHMSELAMQVNSTVSQVTNDLLITCASCKRGKLMHTSPLKKLKGWCQKLL